MKPTEFPQQTMVLAKHQPQYEPLPIHYDPNLGACIARFEPTNEERKAIADGAPVWFWQYTFGRPFQPVVLTVDNPWPPAQLKNEVVTVFDSRDARVSGRSEIVGDEITETRTSARPDLGPR